MQTINNPQTPHDTSSPTDASTTRHATRYLVIGIILTLFNFIIYSILARIINNNELLWLDSIISYMLATFLAYVLHSRITWKERNPGKFGIIKFFIWNIITAVAISPLLTLLFSLLTPLYELIFNITSSINLPLDYNFVESTGIFSLTTVITMILNYLFYDKLVFGKKS